MLSLKLPNDEDLARKGIVTEDRIGSRRKFPIMTLSGGALKVSPGDFVSFRDVSAALSKVKKQAKNCQKTAIVFSDEDHIESVFLETGRQPERS